MGLASVILVISLSKIESINPLLLKRKWDNQNVLDYAIKEAREVEQIKVIKNLILQLGLSDEQTAGIADVSIDLVKKIRADLNKKI